MIDKIRQFIVRKYNFGEFTLEEHYKHQRFIDDFEVYFKNIPKGCGGLIIEKGLYCVEGDLCKECRVLQKGVKK